MSVFQRWWRWGLVALSLVLAIGFVVFAFQHNTLPIISSALLSLFIVGNYVIDTVKWARRGSQAAQPADPTQLSSAADALAQLVEDKIYDDPTAGQLKAHEPINLTLSVVTGSIPGLVGRTVPIGADTIKQLAAEFPTSPTKRLVILGQSGSGKTTLAILLAMKLLESRQKGTGIVPVMLPIAEWDAQHESGVTWLARRIGEIYPALRDVTRYGLDAPKRLLTSRMVLPILDGFDELPACHRVSALSELNELMGFTDSLVLTTRIHEYNDALAQGNEGLSKTLALRIGPVELRDVIPYIEDRTTSEQLEKWQPVFDHIRQSGSGRNSPLTAVLSMPVMVSLTRRVCNAGGTDPNDLISDKKRFPDNLSIERHLLEGFIPAVFDQAWQKKQSRWTGEQATHWLRTVAEDLHGANTFDFRWWALYQTTGSLTRPLMRAAILGLLVWVLGSLVYGFTTGIRHGLNYAVVHGPIHGLAFGLATVVTSLLVPRIIAAKGSNDWRQSISAFVLVGLGACCSYGIVHGSLAATTYGIGDGVVNGLGFGLIVGTGFAFGAWFAGLLMPPDEPTRADLHIAGRGRLFIRTISVTIANSTLVGVLIGVPSELIRGIGVTSRDHPPIGFWMCIAFGLCYGIVIGIIRWVSEPLASDKAATPRSSLIADRALVLLRSTLLGATVIAVFAVMAIVQPGQGMLYTFATQGGIEGGIMTGFVCALSGAWPFYAFTHIRFALIGKLPWRFMAFLETSRRLGILRQAGDVYQFRHSALRDYLAGVKHPLP